MALTTREIKPYREETLVKQKGVCPLCENEILEGEATLDHDYSTGHVRAVLHRSCNGAEGQVKRWAGQRSKGEDPLLWIKNLIKYWEKDWSGNPVHPTHKQSLQKLKKKRTKRRRSTKGTRKKRTTRTS